MRRLLTMIAPLVLIAVGIAASPTRAGAMAMTRLGYYSGLTVIVIRPSSDFSDLLEVGLSGFTYTSPVQTYLPAPGGGIDYSDWDLDGEFIYDGADDYVVGPATDSNIFAADFEQGLQGWELRGSAQRVQTQLLGGEWAIFGDGFIEGGAGIELFVPLAPGDSTSVRELFDSTAFTLSFESIVVAGEGRPSSAVTLLEDGIRLSLTWVNSRDAPVVAFIDDIRVTSVPEPAALALVALGVGALIGLRVRA